jgi:hypothetical protein
MPASSLRLLLFVWLTFSKHIVLCGVDSDAKYSGCSILTQRRRMLVFPGPGVGARTFRACQLTRQAVDCGDEGTCDDEDVSGTVKRTGSGRRSLSQAAEDVQLKTSTSAL